MEELDRETKQRLVDEISPWHHSIRVAEGVVTPGSKTLQHHHQELIRLQLPNLAGKSVLDIGAWDGYYPFMAEGAAASRSARFTPCPSCGIRSGFPANAASISSIVC